MTRVRIVAWNCAMALHNKWDQLLALEPDIAVVAECAQPETVAAKRARPLGATSQVWTGSIPFKGLGVFTFGDWHATPADFVDDDLQFMLPVHVQGPVPFTLLGAWAMNHRAKRTPAGTKPGRQVQLAIERAVATGTHAPLVVAGDFNNNVCWDKGPGPRTMADCIATCEAAGLRSAYHSAGSVEFGAEPDPTHFWEARGGTVCDYHIDYIWAPTDWRIADVTVGPREQRYDTKLSDHAPLACTYDTPN